MKSMSIAPLACASPAFFGHWRHERSSRMEDSQVDIHPRSAQYRRVRRKQILISPTQPGGGDEVAPRQLVIEGLRRMGWSEADLRSQRKGEPRKVDLAWELRSQTTMPLAWIAERLNMGTRGHLAWLLQQRGKSQPAAPANQRLRRI